MKLPVTLERDESGFIVAECPSIPGCVSQGRTEELFGSYNFLLEIGGITADRKTLGSAITATP